jgi:hypothetical protein
MGLCWPLGRPLPPLARFKMLDKSLEKQEHERRFFEIQRPCYTERYNHSSLHGDDNKIDFPKPLILGMIAV